MYLTRREMIEKVKMAFTDYGYKSAIHKSVINKILLLGFAIES